MSSIPRESSISDEKAAMDWGTSFSCSDRLVAVTTMSADTASAVPAPSAASCPNAGLASATVLAKHKSRRAGLCALVISFSLMLSNAHPACGLSL